MAQSFLKKCFGFTLALILMASLTWSQAYRGRGRVKGIVTSSDGNPVEGVKVKLWNVEKDAGFDVTTNKKGEWVASFIRGGEWNIDFEKAGYLPKKISVHLNELSKNDDITVVLEEVQAPTIPADILDRVDESNRLFQEKRYDESLTILNELISKYPDVKVLHWNIGNCYYGKGEYQTAIDHYMMAKDDYPHKQEFWTAVGNAYMQMKQFDKAMEAYKNIGIQNMDDPAALYNLGEVMLSQNQLELSIQALERAVSLQPNFIDALYLLGTAYMTKGNNTLARAVFEQYLQYDATSDRAKEVQIMLRSLK